MNYNPDSKRAQRPSSNSLGSPSPILNWFQRVTRRLSIRTKISCGYALSLSIAVVGTTAGILIAEYYQQEARKLEEDALEEIYLINHLQTTLLKARISKQQLLFLWEKPKPLQQEYSEFRKYIAELDKVWSEFKSTEGNTKNAKVEELAGEAERIREVLQTYDSSIQAYLRQTDELIKEIDPSSLKSEEVEAAQKRLLDFNTGSLPITINYLIDDLSKLTKFANAEYKQAEAQYQAAQILRVEIIGGSIVLSVVLATLLALYTSKAIAQPIQTLTTVAHQVTQDANFDRQAPVTTEDEVGVLGTAFNTLIQRVAKYTKQLELESHTLEKRVIERTQELEQKNQELLQAHEEQNQILQNLRQTQAQLIQTEKMSSLGHLVAGIAHEINNPINFISNYIHFAKDHVQDLLELVNLYQQHYPNSTPAITDFMEVIEFDVLVEDLPGILDRMEMGTERICQLVLSLRNFYRLDGAEMTEVDLHQGIESTLLILNHQLKDNIEIVKQYGDLPLIECYPTQLNQIFMNILQNAIDALTEADQTNKQITIKTETVAPNQVSVRIRDNGMGMPSLIKDKIFDPFFTTKEVGKGTGLGLAICAQIINKHQGHIEAISMPGQGLEFVIDLPFKQPPR
jgi:signal transduction histidine kinase